MQKLIKRSSKKQKGFTIIAVLIMTMMAGTVVLNSLQDTVAQERLSGNFQKKMNARLIAEKGVFDTVDSLKTELESNANYTFEELIAAVSNNGVITHSSTDSKTKYHVSLAPSGSELIVQSGGLHHEGESKLQAIFALESSPTPGTSPFGKGITACESINVSGSGMVDSYKSSVGEYNVSTTGVYNKNDKVTLRTLRASGEVKLTGGADIDGDIIAVNKITFSGSANVSGNVHSNTGLTLPSDSVIGGNASTCGNYTQASGQVGGSIHANGTITLSETPVGGNITSRKTIKVTGQTIAGYLLALQDITLKEATITGGAKTHANYSQTGKHMIGMVRATGNATLINILSNNNDLRHGGVGSPAEYNASPYRISPAPVIEAVPEVAFVPLDDEQLDLTAPDALTCDPLNIGPEILAVDNMKPVLKDLKISSSGDKGNIYQLTRLSAAFITNGDNPGSDAKNINKTDAPFLGNTVPFLMYKNVYVDGALTVQAGQHVTLYVEGGFTMSGASTLTIPDNSSLTIVIKGALNIGAGAQVYTPTNGITAQGTPVFSIYSSYSGTGIDLTGGTEQVYAAIYAPLSDITIASSVGFKGALLGNKINVTGAGGIHYDESLGNAGGEPGGLGGTRLVFKGWRYL